MKSVELINGLHMLNRTNSKPGGLLMFVPDIFSIGLVVRGGFRLDDEVVGYTK